MSRYCLFSTKKVEFIGLLNVFTNKKKTKFELIEVSKPVEKVLAMARKFL